MKTFEELRAKYSPFYEAVKKWHDEAPRPHRGHGLDHDVTVAMLSLRIAPDEKVGELAWIASLLHSVDRTVERANKMAFALQVDNLMSYLPALAIGSDNWELIREAALRHSEFNRDDQSLVQQTLMDADRLANLMALVAIRAGQLLADKPAIEFAHVDAPNPASTYATACSVFDDLRANLSMLGAGHTGYIEQLRLPKAVELGRKYHAQLLGFVALIQEQHRELGLAGIEL